MQRGLYKIIFKGRLSDAFSRFRFFITRKPGTGWTEFAQMKIMPEYIAVDRAKKQVTAIVKYEGVVYLTVTVDAVRNTAKAEGNLKKIKKVIQPFTKQRYIDMIKEEARFLVSNSGAYHSNSPEAFMETEKE